APTPSPASAPMIGPAAMKGPRPGMAGKQSQRAAHYAARGRTGRSTFRCFGVLFSRTFPCGVLIGCQHRDVVVAKARCEQLVDARLSCGPRFKNSECCCIFSCHMLISFLIANCASG